MTLRCTRKLLKGLNASARDSATPPTTTLGDWYANIYDARPEPLVIGLNERTLIAVVIQTHDASSLAIQFCAAVVELLAKIGIPNDSIATKRRAMAEIAFGPTANRKVLGCLNEAALALSVEFDWAHEKHLGDHALHLSQLIYSVNEYRRPCDLARELFEVALPRSRTGRALAH